MQKYDFVGNYTRQGNYLVRDGLKLLISERKTTTPAKPPQFMIDKTRKGGQYISSLFKLSENQWVFDYGGQSYKLTFNPDGQAVIESHIIIS